MKATDGQLGNFTIHWPAEEMRRIPSILRNGICPSYRVPRKALTPGAEVALVDKSGRVILIFTLKSIREFEEERANGARCHLIAYAGTMRRPGKEDPKRLVVNRYGAGAISYYDRKSRRPIFYSESDGAPEEEGVLSPFPASRKEYSVLANNVAKTLSQPERALIKGYTKWTGCAEAFRHQYLREARLYTDLFLPARYTLFEAKCYVDRVTLRTALGQLLDYQHWYERHPRLAVLLPKRPTDAMIELFTAKRVSVVWRTRGGAFDDSAGGIFTRALREKALVAR